MADKRFEGIPEFIGLVIILATGATLSALYERGCQDTNKLTITAHQAGEVWLSVIADKDEMKRVGEVKVGEPAVFDAPVGGVRVELRRGEEVLHTSFVQMFKKTPSAVVLGGGTFTDARDGEVYPYVVDAGGLRWMGEGLRYKADGSTCSGDPAAVCHDRRYPRAQALTACPAGWRVPTNQDWRQLAQQFGMCRGCLELGKNEGSAGADRLARGDEFGIRLGFGDHWSADDAPPGVSAVNPDADGFIINAKLHAGGEGERTMTASERSDAERRERQRPDQPSTLNERRKRDARLNAKVRYTYDASVSMAIYPVSSKKHDAALRCVSD